MSPWYRRSLALISLVLVVVALLAGLALREATNAANDSARAACLGANKAKAATTLLINTIVDRVITPAPDETPAQTARRVAGAAAYEQLRTETKLTLAPEDCTP